MHEDRDDDLRELATKAVIALAYLLVIANIAFQAFSKELKLDPVVTGMITTAFATLIWYLYKHGNGKEHDEEDSRFNAENNGKP
jgi:hypothetical protein